MKLLNTTLCLLLMFVLLACEEPPARDVDYRVYHQMINDAHLAIYHHDYELADASFKAAYNYVPRAFKHDYLKSAINAMRIGEEEQAFIWLDSAALLGITEKSWERDTAIYRLTEAEQWSEFQNKFPDLHKRYKSRLNKDVLASVAWLDSLEIAFQESIGTDEEITWQWFYKTNHDSLLALIERHDGWPGISLKGDNTMHRENQWMVLQHRTWEDFRSLDSVYLQAIIDGELYPHQYGYAYDCHYLNRVFSAYHRKLKEEGEATEATVPDIEFWFGELTNLSFQDDKIKGLARPEFETNLDRKKWGMPPVRDFLKFSSSGNEVEIIIE